MTGKIRRNHEAEQRKQEADNGRNILMKYMKYLFLGTK